MIDAQSHWENVYRTKAPDQVSWYRPHLDRSLAMIRAVAPDRAAAIIDVGGGEATLVDDLIADGYGDVTVLDLSARALEVARERLGDRGRRAHWLVGDVTTTALPPARYDVWHDRAVFHFLTTPEARTAYVRQVLAATRPGAHVLVATFGPEGPTKCSGLDVVRYDAASLHDQFGRAFRLVRSETETHETPFGTTQQFVYCLCRIDVGASAPSRPATCPPGVDDTRGLLAPSSSPRR
jgi:SAM-dependent methyltransferase